MRTVTRLLQDRWRPIAVTACLLGMFWPLVQVASVWGGRDPFDGDALLFRQYFLDQYVAALALGLVAGRWAAVNVAPLGAIAAIIVTVGARETADSEINFADYGPAWGAYLEAGLAWLWIAGLIALGVALSRRIGGLHFSLRAEPESPLGRDS